MSLSIWRGTTRAKLWSGRNY